MRAMGRAVNRRSRKRPRGADGTGNWHAPARSELGYAKKLQQRRCWSYLRETILYVLETGLAAAVSDRTC